MHLGQSEPSGEEDPLPLLSRPFGAARVDQHVEVAQIARESFIVRIATLGPNLWLRALARAQDRLKLGRRNTWHQCGHTCASRCTHDEGLSLKDLKGSSNSLVDSPAAYFYDRRPVGTRWASRVQGNEDGL